MWLPVCRVYVVQLDVAFAVLDRMKRERVDMLEIVFRSLIEACGRCGDGERALDVTKTMNKAGFVPDSSVYNCVFRSFTMNGSCCVCGCVWLCVAVWLGSPHTCHRLLPIAQPKGTL